MKGLYRMEIDYGRMGDLSGIFIADTEDVKNLIEEGKEVSFGEVLGKHSEVNTAITDNDLTLITTDPLVIGIVEEHGLENGFNPFDYERY